MATLNAHTFPTRQDAESRYLVLIDNAAESTRMLHLTPGTGQSMTYDVKWQEALAGHGPMIEAEAEALDMTVTEVIESILVARQQWETLGSQIEALRLKAKKDVRAATAAVDMHQVVKTLKQQLTLLQ